MQEIPVVQLLVFLAFILVPLFRWLRRYAPPPSHEPPRPPPLHQPTPRTYSKTPPVELIASAGARTTRVESSPALPSSPRRHRAQTLFANRRDLRRAIILLTVLGPCRAADEPAASARRDL
jgi:hypothetical protein